MVFTAWSEVQGWQKLCRSIKTGIYLQVYRQGRKNIPAKGLHICSSSLKREDLGYGQHNGLSCNQVCFATEESLRQLMHHITCVLGTCKAQLAGLLPFKAASSFVFLFSQRQHYQKCICESRLTPVTEVLRCSQTPWWSWFQCSASC